MNEPKPPSRGVRLKFEVTPAMYDCLRELAQTGLYGSSPQEAALDILRQGIRIHAQKVRAPASGSPCDEGD